MPAFELQPGDAVIAPWLGRSTAHYLGKNGRIHQFGGSELVSIRNESLLSSLRNGMVVWRNGIQVWPDHQTMEHRARLFLCGIGATDEESQSLVEAIGANWGETVLEAKSFGCKSVEDIVGYCFST